MTKNATLVLLVTLAVGCKHEDRMPSFTWTGAPQEIETCYSLEASWLEDCRIVVATKDGRTALLRGFRGCFNMARARTAEISTVPSLCLSPEDGRRSALAECYPILTWESR